MDESPYVDDMDIEYDEFNFFREGNYIGRTYTFNVIRD